MQEAQAVRAPGHGDDFHLIPPAPQILDQLAVIEVAAGDGLQAAVNHQAQMQLTFLAVGGPGDVVLPNLGGEGVEGVLEAA